MHQVSNLPQSAERAVLKFVDRLLVTQAPQMLNELLWNLRLRPGNEPSRRRGDPGASASYGHYCLKSRAVNADDPDRSTPAKREPATIRRPDERAGDPSLRLSRSLNTRQPTAQ